MRNDMFRHIATLSHAEIDRIGTPSLINRITNDVNQLQTAVAMLSAIRLVIRAPFLVIGAYCDGHFDRLENVRSFSCGNGIDCLGSISDYEPIDPIF